MPQWFIDPIINESPNHQSPIIDGHLPTASRSARISGWPSSTIRACALAMG
jgi:hypothetical protein